MKKSSFLHKPKDLLSKSFNPAKCKTALKLASSRIKLLKNKKENQVKQMKRELAQFLESGQDQTALIRVEHVVREEKMMAAYELLEIYCELIVARLPIIETQKNCPIDLKEAITSVIFASPRCSDITELSDVRKQFTGKYGKEFIAAAIDLRPDCGVSRMMIEKLSARAPDGQTKIKVLTAIAEEHNIKWDPKSFGENEALPPNDLLNGPATFEKVNLPHPEEPRFHTPDVQAPSPTMRNQSSNFSENNVKSQRNETPASGLNNGNRNSASSGPRPDTADTRQSNHQEGSAYSSGRQNWNMNFKDAASAAQAAAESAEHASMAARAAAELSSLGRTGMQYSPDSEDLSGLSQTTGEEIGKHPHSRVGENHAPRDSANSYLTDHHPMVENERRGRHYSVESQKLHGYADTGQETRIPRSEFSDDHPPRDSATSSFAEPPSEFQDMQRINVGSDNMHSVPEKSYGQSVDIEKRYPQSSSKYSDDRPERDSATSSLTSKVSFDSDPPVSGLREAERYSENSLFKGEDLGPELKLKKGTYKDEPERLNFRKEEFNHYDHDIFEDKSTKQSSNIHFSPHSASGFDDNYVNSGPEKHGSDSSDRHSVNISEDLFNKMAQSSSHDGGVATFDDYGSDEDFGLSNSSHLNFNEESTLFRPPGRTSPSRSSADSLGFQSSQLHKGSESLFPTKQNLFSEFSESSEVPVDSPEQDKSGPVMFDDSDGPSSDDESNMNQPWVHNGKDSADVHSEQYQTLSPFHDSRWKNNQRNETVVQSQEDFGFSKAPADKVDKLVSSQSSFVVVDDAKHGKASSSSSMRQMDDEDSHPGAELNFGKLTGGLRQKGRARFPFQSHQVDEFSASSIKVAEADPKMENLSNARKSEIPKNPRPLRLPSSHPDSDSESSDEEYEKKPTSHIHESYNAERKSNLKPNVRGPVRYFDSESSGSEDDSTKQVLTGRSPLGSGVSRRTKGTPADSASTATGDSRRPKVTPSYSRSFFQEVQATSYTSSNSGEGRPSAASFSGSENPQPSKSHVRLSGQFKDLEKPSSERKAYKPNLESNISANIENKKSSSAAQSSIAEQKVEPSVTIKPSSSNHVTREDSDKKASHVHPKLPEYDTIAARIQAIRSNRQ